MGVAGGEMDEQGVSGNRRFGTPFAHSRPTVPFFVWSSDNFPVVGLRATLDAIERCDVNRSQTRHKTRHQGRQE